MSRKIPKGTYPSYLGGIGQAVFSSAIGRSTPPKNVYPSYLGAATGQDDGHGGTGKFWIYATLAIVALIFLSRKQ